MMRNHSARQFGSVTIALSTTLAVVLLAGANAAAAPQITNVSPRGLQSGSTTTLTIDGADLLPNPRILTAAPISGQSIKAGATSNRIQIDVALPYVPPGIYKL